MSDIPNTTGVPNDFGPQMDEMMEAFNQSVELMASRLEDDEAALLGLWFLPGGEVNGYELLLNDGSVIMEQGPLAAWEPLQGGEGMDIQVKLEEGALVLHLPTGPRAIRTLTIGDAEGVMEMGVRLEASHGLDASLELFTDPPFLTQVTVMQEESWLEAVRQEENDVFVLEAMSGGMMDLETEVKGEWILPEDAPALKDAPLLHALAEEQGPGLLLSLLQDGSPVFLLYEDVHALLEGFLEGAKDALA